MKSVLRTVMFLAAASVAVLVFSGVALALTFLVWPWTGGVWDY